MNLDQMIQALQGLTPDTQLREHQLEAGCYYFGEGRFIGSIGLWDGKIFHGFQNKFGRYLNTTADYGDRGFTPLVKLNFVDARIE